jgi:hypothetical protein
VDAGESFATMLGETELDPDPHAGDVAICLNCGTLLVYLDEENNTRLAQLQDLIPLRDKRRKQLKKAQKYVRRRGRIWPKKIGGERFSPN